MNAAISPAIVVVRRTIAAPAEELFDAWLDPEALGCWMLPNAIRRTQARVDARVGGRYEILMESETDSFPHNGEYRLIDRPHRLVFTWVSRGTNGRETLVTVDFRPVDLGTEIVVAHEWLPQAAMDAHTGGWASAIEHLDHFARSRTPPVPADAAG